MIWDRKKGGMVRPEGVEPPTYWFVASCSIQLSYGRTLLEGQLSKDTGFRPSEQPASGQFEEILDATTEERGLARMYKPVTSYRF